MIKSTLLYKSIGYLPVYNLTKKIWDKVANQNEIWLAIITSLSILWYAKDSKTQNGNLLMCIKALHGQWEKTDGMGKNAQ